MDSTPGRKGYHMDYDMQAALTQGYAAGQNLRREWGREKAAVYARDHASHTLASIAHDLTHARRTVDNAFRVKGDIPWDRYAEAYLALAAWQVFRLAGYVAGSRWEDTTTNAVEFDALMVDAKAWPVAQTEEVTNG